MAAPVIRPWRRPWVTAIAAGLGAAAVGAQVYAGWGDDPAWPHLAARAGLKGAWMMLLALALWETVAGLRARWRGDADAGQEIRPDGTLSASGIMRRTVLVAALALPRSLVDPAGGAVAALWLLVILPCGYVYVEHLARSRPRWSRLTTAYWLAWAIVLAPWGIPALSTRWPSGGAF